MSDIRIVDLIKGTSSYSGREGDELAVCEMDGRTLRLTKAELWKFVKMTFQAEKVEKTSRATVTTNGSS